MRYLKFILLILCMNQTTKILKASSAGLGKSLIDVFFWGMNQKEQGVLNFSFSSTKIPGTQETLLSKITSYVETYKTSIDLSIIRPSTIKVVAHYYPTTSAEPILILDTTINQEIAESLYMGYVGAYVGVASDAVYSGPGGEGKFTGSDMYNFDKIHIHIEAGNITVVSHSTMGLGKSLQDLFFWGMDQNEQGVLNFSFLDTKIPNSQNTLLSQIAAYAVTNDISIKLSIVKPSTIKVMASYYPTASAKPISILDTTINQEIPESLYMGYVGAYVGVASDAVYSGPRGEGKFTGQDIYVFKDIVINIKSGNIEVNSFSQGLGQPLQDIFFFGMDGNTNAVLNFSFLATKIPNTQDTLLSKITPYVIDHEVFIKLSIIKPSTIKVVASYYSKASNKYISILNTVISESISDELFMGYIGAYVGNIAQYGANPPEYKGPGTQGKFTSSEIYVFDDINIVLKQSEIKINLYNIEGNYFTFPIATTMNSGLSKSFLNSVNDDFINKTDSFTIGLSDGLKYNLSYPFVIEFKNVKISPRPQAVKPVVKPQKSVPLKKGVTAPSSKIAATKAKNLAKTVVTPAVVAKGSTTKKVKKVGLVQKPISVVAPKTKGSPVAKQVGAVKPI